MRYVSTLVVCLVLSSAARALAVPCNATTDLCTGNPCITGSLTLDDSCTLDFMGADLVIGGALTLPPNKILNLTAGSISVEGRIEAPNGTVTLTSGAAATLNTEIDVSPGSLTVNAAGNISAKSRLKAKPGGSVTLDAGGTIETRVTAVIEVQDGGAATLSGDGGVTVGGKIFAYGSTVQVTSSAGIVALDQDIRLDGTVPGSVTVAGAAGVDVNKGIKASRAEPGNTVTIQSSGGDVNLNGKIRVSGTNAGSILIQAPNGQVGGKQGLDAKGKTNGGSVTVDADVIHLLGNVDARGGLGTGGTVAVEATTLVTFDASDIDVTAKGNGGSVSVKGGPASGDVVLDGNSIKASGNGGGLVQISAPAGHVNLVSKITASSFQGVGGKILVDGASVTIGPKAVFDTDGDGPGSEIRIEQTGPGVCTVSGTFTARDGGTIAALAPAASLTLFGKYRVDTPGCIGASCGGTLTVAQATFDVPTTPSCP